ncbi:hypothetical protein Tco_0143394 [Tanacetum coccineum]
MADTTPKVPKISLKVMVHKAKNRAIYAVADSSFVDILFSFMTLPLGTIVKILGKCTDQKVQALGSLKNLYQSLTDLPANYLVTVESKHMLLNPRSSSYDISKKLKIKVDDIDPPKFFFNLVCIKHHGAYFSPCNLARCSYCGNLMTGEFKNEDPVTDTSSGGVFVSDVTTFIITEDLRVFPNATGVSIQLLCDFGISNASQLDERNLDVGLEQGLYYSSTRTFLVFPNTNLTQEYFNQRQGTSIQHVINKEIATTSKRMMLKIVLQKSTSKFLFAEAKEDFVDFVFGFLKIPLGTVVGKLMNGSSSLTNLDNLFASASDLKVGKHIKSQDLGKASSTSADPRVQGEFVKASAKFMLTDDLVITPLSTFSTIALLNKLKVPMHDVVEHELSIGTIEGLKILKASLNSSMKCLSPLSVALPKKNDIFIPISMWFFLIV